MATRKKGATQTQVAELAGVSQVTVSQILNGTAGKKYSEETQEKVRQIAREVGYIPNRASLTMRKGRSNLIGIIHFGGALEMAGKIAMCLPQLVNEHGYDYLVVDLRWHGGNVERIINEMIHARVEGVIVSLMMESFGPEYTALLAKAGIPVVSLFGSDRLNVPTIRADVKSTFATLTRHLLSTGHRRLLHIAGGSSDWPILRRMEGFQEGMQGAGPCAHFLESEFFDEWPTFCAKQKDSPFGAIVRVDNERHGYDFLMAAYDICRRLFARGPMPDAIVSANDQGAFGVFNAVYQHGIRVPEDLVITGCDDDQFTSLPMFELTTIRFDIETACRKILNMLLQEMKTGHNTQQDGVCPTEIIFRSSTGRNLAPGALSVPGQQPPHPPTHKSHIR